MTWFLMQFGVNKHLWFFKDYKLHLPYRHMQFCCTQKLCTRNHAVTYTNKITTDHIEYSGLMIVLESQKVQTCFAFSTAL